MGVRDLPLGLIALSSVIAALAYGLMRLIQQRRFYKDLVCHYNYCESQARTRLINMQPKPPHSFLFGHLKLMGEIFAMLPSDVHYQCAVTTMAKKYDLPRVFYLDLWPMADGQVCVTGT
jgi:hypothetical protein